MPNNNQERSRKGTSGLVFVGCLILGLALGILAGNVAVGLLIGLGVGFIDMAIAHTITGKRRVAFLPVAGLCLKPWQEVSRSDHCSLRQLHALLDAENGRIKVNLEDTLEGSCI